MATLVVCMFANSLPLSNFRLSQVTTRIIMSKKNFRQVLGLPSPDSASHPSPNCGTLHPRARNIVLKMLSKRLSLPSKAPEGEDPVVNSLIMEYFKWVGYHHAADMLVKETKIPSSVSPSQIKMTCDVLRGNLTGGTVELPLILRLITKK